MMKSMDKTVKLPPQSPPVESRTKLKVAVPELIPPLEVVLVPVPEEPIEEAAGLAAGLPPELAPRQPPLAPAVLTPPATNAAPGSNPPNGIIDVSKIPKAECRDMRIEFGSGFPGRSPNETAYQPLHPDIFSHGPALIVPI
ncbi:hypothetical protein VP01_2399g1 [Puccinia sorghi]|uniref:Uncharacterized protein n=1 Tax=Puccinia sorghi TaxID=27349 RepID=A0A0L6V7H2_9BASI|nr:hypothetical protein VP01_2399g1 [Puccinia sorghi]